VFLLFLSYSLLCLRSLVYMRTINRLFDDNDDDDYDDNCEKSVPGFVAYYHILSGTDEGSGGLTIVPIVPWHGAPR